jgi:ABC-type antimicrobial peptide transport system permease subunit
MSWELALRRAVGANRKRVVWQIVRRTASIGLFGALLGLFFYAVVVAPAITGALPELPLARPDLMFRAVIPPLLLALVAAIAPGLQVTGRPPSQVLR